MGARGGQDVRRLADYPRPCVLLHCHSDSNHTGALKGPGPSEVQHGHVLWLSVVGYADWFAIPRDLFISSVLVIGIFVVPLKRNSCNLCWF